MIFADILSFILQTAISQVYHITDTGTMIYFSEIFHNQAKIYRWVFNSLSANGDNCRLLINFANGLVPDQA